MILDECGKTEKYKFTIIMYNKTVVDELEKVYTVFIAHKDYDDNKLYIIIKANIEINFIP
ncbi:MAG: hypothetical protein IJD58_10005 [Lachnospiraceae bacterium]|nr:hypothetical protein [Lachnospiraceae bacterium]